LIIVAFPLSPYGFTYLSQSSPLLRVVISMEAQRDLGPSLRQVGPFAPLTSMDLQKSMVAARMTLEATADEVSFMCA
jgi:hypothetical protein